VRNAKKWGAYFIGRGDFSDFIVLCLVLVFREFLHYS
jgi:hypothetical protein